MAVIYHAPLMHASGTGDERAGNGWGGNGDPGRGQYYEFQGQDGSSMVFRSSLFFASAGRKAATRTHNYARGSALFNFLFYSDDPSILQVFVKARTVGGLLLERYSRPRYNAVCFAIMMCYYDSPKGRPGSGNPCDRGAARL